MQPDALDDLTRGLMVRFGVAIPDPKKWIPHQPFDRQQLFLELEHLEAFYGGAAGGGKSDALLMAALQYVDIPGYQAIIFRRSLTDFELPDSLIPRSHQWLDKTRARFVAQKMRWEFPSGAVLQFGYLDNEDDKYRYQGAAFQFIAFDELTHFTETQYRYLFSRLRRLSSSNIPMRIRSASNPGGRGALWVRKRFIPDGFTFSQATQARAWLKQIVMSEEEQELLKVLLAEGQITEWPTARAFVPSRVQDNAYLDRAQYIQSLFQLDRVVREQLLSGDWSIQVTGRQRFNNQFIEMFRPREPWYVDLRLSYDGTGREIVKPFRGTENSLVKVYVTPDITKTYAAGLDTAEGKDMSEEGSEKHDPDYCVGVIREAHTGEECARLRGQITETVFGEMMYVLLRWYNSPFICPEIKGGYGRVTLGKLLDLGYEWEYIFNKHLMGELSGLPPKKDVKVGYHDLGFDTTPTSRPKLISLLDEAIINHTIETYDFVAVDEYRHFCYNAQNKPEAESGWHDDTVIADALCEVARIFAVKFEPMRRRRNQRQQVLPERYGQQPLTPAERQKMLMQQRRDSTLRKR